MDIRPRPIVWIGFLFLLILFACQQDANSKVVEKHLAEYPDVRKKYIYQSLIRLANINNDPDFDKLIRDVDKIIIYFPPREDTTYQIKALRSNISETGYELLFDVRTASKERINLWVDESGKEPHYIGLFDTTADDYIFEIDGQLDLDYISSINMIDQETLRKFLN